jgi:hypothetical protein
MLVTPVFFACPVRFGGCMSTVLLRNISNATLDVFFRDYIYIYGSARELHDERVVAIGILGPNNTLPLSKMQWSRSFEELPGLEVVGGSVKKLYHDD